MSGVVLWGLAALLGGAGAVARVLTEHEVSLRWRHPFPAARLVVNVLGSLVLGILSGAHVSGDALFLEATATLGSFTTFSGWMAETERLGDAGRRDLAALNVGVSLAAGVVALLLGRLIGGAF
ncbi:MAG TPA: fluoride efflux transporter CrcB [Solirubrobacteraceae bacterium]